MFRSSGRFLQSGFATHVFKISSPNTGLRQVKQQWMVNISVTNALFPFINREEFFSLKICGDLEEDTKVILFLTLLLPLCFLGFVLSAAATC